MVIVLGSLEEAFTDLVRPRINDSISYTAEVYVIETVSNFVTASHADPKSIHLNDLLQKGLDSDGWVGKEYLKVTGDLALFISGIFPDSLDSKRTAYSLGYYIDVGRTAYENLRTELFTELADKFPQVVDILNDVSVRIDLTNKDLAKYLKRRRTLDARTTRRKGNSNQWPRIECFMRRDRDRTNDRSQRSHQFRTL